MKFEKFDDAIVMKVGPHSDMSLDEIIASKIMKKLVMAFTTGDIRVYFVDQNKCKNFVKILY